MLSSQNLDDWMSKLRETFLDLNLKFAGGESSNEAMVRARGVLDDLEADTCTVVVTHGNLMALLLKSYDDRYGFEDWRELSNPDVFQVGITQSIVTVKRVWEF